MTNINVGEDARSSGVGEVGSGWLAILAVLLFFVAMFWYLGFLPPLPPSGDAEFYAQHYRDHAFDIRLGSILMMIAASMLFPMFGAMTAAMFRMKGRPYTLACTQLATAIVSFAPLFMANFFFAAASFRPERSADDIYAISDVGWFFLVMPTPAALIQMVAFGMAILGDDKDNPVFPRWLGYFNFWVGFAFFGGILIPLFKEGPFAWDGILAYWVPVTVFGVWAPVVGWQLIRLGGRLSRGELI